MTRSPVLIHRWFPHPQGADWAYGPGLGLGDFERCVKAIDKEWKGPFGPVGPLIVPGEPPLVLVGERIDDLREVETRGKPMLRLAVVGGLPGWRASASIAAGLVAKDVEVPGEHDSLFVEWDGDTLPFPPPEPERPDPVDSPAEPAPTPRRGVMSAVFSGVACLVLGALLGFALNRDPASTPSTRSAGDLPGGKPPAVEPTLTIKPAGRPVDPPAIAAKGEALAVAPAATIAPAVDPVASAKPTAPPPNPTIPARPVDGIRSLMMVKDLDALLEKAKDDVVKNAARDGELYESYRKARDSVVLEEITTKAMSDPLLEIERLKSLRKLLELDPTEPLDKLLAKARDGVALGEIMKQASRPPQQAIESLNSLRERLKPTSTEPLETLLAKARDSAALGEILKQAGQPPLQAIEGLRSLRKNLELDPKSPVKTLLIGELLRAYLKAFEEAYERVDANEDDGSSMSGLQQLAADYLRDGLIGNSRALDKYVYDLDVGVKAKEQVLLSAKLGKDTIKDRAELIFSSHQPQVNWVGTRLGVDSSGLTWWSFRVPVTLHDSLIMVVKITLEKNRGPDLTVEELHETRGMPWHLARSKIALKVLKDHQPSEGEVTLERKWLALPEPPKSKDAFRSP